MDERRKRLDSEEPGDSTLLALTLAHQVLAYYYRRVSGRILGVGPTKETTVAALRCLGISWPEGRHNFLLVGSRCFQVIQDASEQFPDIEEIQDIYKWSTDHGCDWSRVPPISQ